MPWMLQPRNYTQILKPNLYNVAYRRVGAYKGMGGLGQSTSSISYLGDYSGYDLANLPYVNPGGAITTTPYSVSPSASPQQTAVALSPGLSTTGIPTWVWLALAGVFVFGIIRAGGA